ncbi:hypothetical protein SUDANB19_00970 [Streptomyces sp. enrichment culture]
MPPTAISVLASHTPSPTRRAGRASETAASSDRLHRAMPGIARRHNLALAG